MKNWKNILIPEHTIFGINGYTELGNSLVQICNIMNLAIKTNSGCKMPSVGVNSDVLEFLKTVPNLIPETWKVEAVEHAEKKYRYIEQKFYFENECFGYKLSNKDRRNILHQYVYPYLNINDSPSVKDDTLVIHIRSGDIFNEWIHQNYVQPPLEYYKKIIDEKQPNDVLIVSQKDLSNPCIDALISWDSKVRIQTGSIEEDVSSILKAKSLVIGFGTFGWMLSLLSKNIENLYCPNIVTDVFSSEFEDCPYNIRRFVFPNYISIGNWKRTNEQMQHMIDYREDFIVEV